MTLLHAVLGGILGWLIWRVSPLCLRGVPRNLPDSDSDTRETTEPIPYPNSAR